MQSPGIYLTFAKHAVRAVGRRAAAKLGRTPQVDAEPPPPVAEPVEDSDRWGEAAETQAAGEALGWLDNPWVVQNYAFPKVFGKAAGETWGRNAAEAFGIPKGLRWLSLGCGGGNIEMQMAEEGLFASMVAMDASPQAIDLARRQAHGRGVTTIDFQVADLNAVVLPSESFDVVHVNMALHHVGALEHLVWQVNESLKQGGVFLANEFVGPNQFQHSPERLRMVRERLAMLPERLRWNPVARETKTAWTGFTRAFWNDWDPTESVRSDEIPSILKMNFPELRAYPYGGSILNLALENIVQNFDLDDPTDLAHLRDLMDYEEGRLTSDFVYYVCPRGSKLARARGRLAATIDIRHRVTMALRHRAMD